MYHNRIIPCLLLRDQGLVKTVKFNKYRYLGDPINAVKIYNDKEVDELIFLDIDATKEKRKPDYNFLKKIAEQCFMPLCYGGGVKTVDEAKRIFELGFEKISLNTAAYNNPDIIKNLVEMFGAQSIVGSMDIRTDWKGHKLVYLYSQKKYIGINPTEYALYLENLGVGEIFLNSIDNDGMMGGYDYQMINQISNSVSVPIIACGGAGKIEDCKKAIEAGASAAAAGSLFVYWGRNKAVLINYPDADEMKTLFS